MGGRSIRLLCLVVGVMLGGLREFLFVNLNYQVDHVFRGTPYSYAHSRFQGWVQGWELGSLLTLKWGLAVGFIAANWGLCMLFARTLPGRKRLYLFITGGFLAIGALALILHAFSRWIFPMEVVSVKLLHLLQYPVPLVFLWAAALLSPASRSAAR